MRKQRNIPFGYILSNGEITLHPLESDTVRQIFYKYLQEGLSYKGIAEFLTTQSITYRENAPFWNKSMVKRILENSKYIGNEQYPAVISEQELLSVTDIREQKNQKSIPPAAVVLIRRKSVCFECGAKIKRHIGNNRKEKWYCKNGCVLTRQISDSSLMNTIMQILNKVIATPSMLGITCGTAFQPNLEITRLTNEINRELEKKELDKEHSKALIMKCAREKYAICSDNTASVQTDALKELLKDKSPMAELDESLFDKAVQNVLIEKNGTVHIRFINQKIISHSIQ